MANTLSALYRTSFALLTDLYQLTMAYGYWKTQIHEREAIFNLIFRKMPVNSGYVVAAGLGSVLDYLENFAFSTDDIDYLRTLKDSEGEALFEPAFLEYLAQLRLSCDIDAVEEGTVVFPQEPIVRVKGSLLQCQLLESAMLNMINFQTLIATKAARICQAAQGEPVLEFGLRRAQGPDGALMASRAAFIGGCKATANVLAGKIYGIPVSGTHAHSWVMVFPSELEAFKAYANALPRNAVFLVDTYNTIEGVKHAIEVGKWLKEQNHRLLGVRLDSGDLAYLSIAARNLLDAAGFHDTVIVASNDLDEFVVSSLKQQGSKVTVWGVGTKLVTAYDQPALDGVYKLAAMKNAQGEWDYKLKLSEQTAKISVPGLLSTRRYSTEQGTAFADVIYDQLKGINDEVIIINPLDVTQRRKIPAHTPYKELMHPIMRAGKIIYDIPSLTSIQQKTNDELACFHESVRRALNPHVYPVGLEEALYNLRTSLVLKARGIE